MKNIIKSTIYPFIWVMLLGLWNTYAAIKFWQEKVDTGLQWSQEWADTAIQKLITNFMAFLYLIAVVYLLWWGFNILTAGWDEEKVKKWKTVIIQSWIWLLVIFLANSIVQWIMKSLFSWTTS